MAKKIRFPLKMNDTDVRSIEELRDNFDIEAVIGYYTSGKLLTWLRDRYYNEEADAVEAISADNEQLGAKLAQALGVEISADDDLDVEEIKYRQEKLEILSRYTADREILDNVDIVAIDQDDLYDILDSGEEKIYLLKETFSIPVRKGGITYIGLNGAKVKLQGKTDFDFNAVGLKFIDVEFVGISEAEDMLAIAQCYFCGNGVIENDQEAFKWYFKAAEKGYVEAQYELGECYYYGHGVQEDASEAFKWYYKAAEQGHIEAQYELGECYYHGCGVQVDNSEAVKWYTKAAEQGYEPAKSSLGECYNEIAAENIYEYQELYEAEMYDESMDCLIKAIEYYQKVADYGNSEAHSWLGDCYYELGEFYYNGYGVPQDYQEAMRWFTKAAESGNANSQKRLGDCYYEGNGVSQDYEKAVEWYTKSAEQGYAEAQLCLGDLYLDGYDGFRKSEEWYRKAAEQGLAEAQFKLSLDLFVFGFGEDDRRYYFEAFQWSKKAAEQGFVPAQSQLASYYEDGYGIPKDISKAIEWYSIAAANGDTEAENKIKILLQKMNQIE